MRTSWTRVALVAVGVAAGTGLGIFLLKQLVGIGSFGPGVFGGAVVGAFLEFTRQRRDGAEPGGPRPTR